MKKKLTKKRLNEINIKLEKIGLKLKENQISKIIIDCGNFKYFLNLKSKTKASKHKDDYNRIKTAINLLKKGVKGAQLAHQVIKSEDYFNEDDFKEIENNILKNLPPLYFVKSALQKLKSPQAMDRRLTSEFITKLFNHAENQGLTAPKKRGRIINPIIEFASIFCDFIDRDRLREYYKTYQKKP